MSAIYAVDTGLFVAMGQPLNQRFRAVRRFALRNELTFVLPQQVYDELTVEDTSVETPPIDEAIEEGWTEVADPLAFENPFVSRAMDDVRRFIVYADDRAQDEIERADSSLAADGDRRRGSGDGYRLIRPNNGHQKSWISLPLPFPESDEIIHNTWLTKHIWYPHVRSNRCMKSRIFRGLCRAKYAAVFAAIGAGIGGLFGRSTASSGAAAGAFIGASIGERLASQTSISERVKDEVNERVPHVSS